MTSADFQGCQGQGSKCCGQEPEAHYHLRFTPADKMEVVVYRCTSEQPFAPGVFEIADLEDYTEQFDDEYSSDNQKQNLVSCYQRTVSHCGS